MTCTVLSIAVLAGLCAGLAGSHAASLHLLCSVCHSTCCELTGVHPSCAGVREPSAAETPAQTLPPRDQQPQQNHQQPQQPYSSGPMDAEAMLSDRLHQVGLCQHVACCGSLLGKLCFVMVSEGLDS